MHNTGNKNDASVSLFYREHYSNWVKVKGGNNFNLFTRRK